MSNALERSRKTPAVISFWSMDVAILLRTVPTNLEVFLRCFMNMWEKQISASVIKIQKENWG